ncbi:MAG TPA: hypothetical protein DCQ83_00045 [Fibrobacteres bacterium]|mgnify:FL=1|jgi:hypothetical protein|nr:hypothetical protein [Fibrobacterota bacterium]
MTTKNSQLYGIAALAALLGIFFLIRRRMRWGFLLFSVLVALAEKWREGREMNRIREWMDSAGI